MNVLIVPQVTSLNSTTGISLSLFSKHAMSLDFNKACISKISFTLHVRKGNYLLVIKQSKLVKIWLKY